MVLSCVRKRVWTTVVAMNHIWLLTYDTWTSK
jgi:hypothetical protein